MFSVIFPGQGSQIVGMGKEFYEKFDVAKDLFKDTIMGKFSPVTGGFISGNNSVYLYTGVQAQYDLGLLKIIPSFAPGYYEAGKGKDLGSALEFKSEVKFDFDFFTFVLYDLFN